MSVVGVVRSVREAHHVAYLRGFPRGPVPDQGAAIGARVRLGVLRAVASHWVQAVPDPLVSAHDLGALETGCVERVALWRQVNRRVTRVPAHGNTIRGSSDAATTACAVRLPGRLVRRARVVRPPGGVRR